MKKTVKKIIKKILDSFGLKVIRIDRGRVSEANRLKWLRDLNIGTVIDVGASKGNATLEFRELFPSATIYAFEPLPDCFAQMQAKLRSFENIHLFNIALSDQKSNANIHRSSYSGSSSLLPMANLHKKLFPITAGEHLVPVATDTLDNIMSLETLKSPVLIKIDVQGFEHKVLAGAVKTLKQAGVIIIETSFHELYIGQPLFGDIYKLLTEQGFTYMGAWDPDFRSPEDGMPLQQDAVFIRSSL